MNAYQYVVTVKARTQAHADQVMAERLQHDEEYHDDAGQAFDYQIPYAQMCDRCLTEHVQARHDGWERDA